MRLDEKELDETVYGSKDGSGWDGRAETARGANKLEGVQCNVVNHYSFQ